MTASPAPVWLLDFDGVLNAISSRGGTGFWDDWRSARIDHPLGEMNRRGDIVRLPLLFSPTVIATVADAAGAGVDVRWLTTWREHTALLPGVVDGLPVLPWLDESILDSSVADGLDPAERMLSGAWKVAVAQTYVPADAPLLWTDDAFAVESLSQGWRRSRTAPTMFLRPNPHHGLLRKHTAEIRRWLGLSAAPN